MSFFEDVVTNVISVSKLTRVFDVNTLTVKVRLAIVVCHQ